MNVEYFPETDMLYIAFVEGISQESEEIADGVVLDFDSAGRVIGIEIEDASQIVDISRLDVSGLPLADMHITQKVFEKLATSASA
jgi:uncharacterized protein YuzE